MFSKKPKNYCNFKHTHMVGYMVYRTHLKPNRTADIQTKFWLFSRALSFHTRSCIQVKSHSFIWQTSDISIFSMECHLVLWAKSKFLWNLEKNSHFNYWNNKITYSVVLKLAKALHFRNSFIHAFITLKNINAKIQFVTWISINWIKRLFVLVSMEIAIQIHCCQQMCHSEICMMLNRLFVAIIKKKEKKTTTDVIKIVMMLSVFWREGK